MFNLLSYAGVSLQAELCLWTLLGLLRTIFDATLFKVNANLKQVWQMSMPKELAMPVQRALRTIISGVMLVQCFTVYIYLAAYIVLLYPIFLEERPTLVLPWLLLAAVRRLLCELTSLAVGLGACLLLGPARPQCVRFLVLKVAAITPAFYMWMLVYSYYNTLKVAAAFKLSPTSLPSDDPDYGLELAVRRRKTKSLLREDQLRRNLVANFNYGERQSIPNTETSPPRTVLTSDDISNSSSQETFKNCETNHLQNTSEAVFSHVQTYEDWLGNEITLPRDADRILEQFVVMLFRISAFLKTGETDPTNLLASSSRFPLSLGLSPNIGDAEPPFLVGSKTVRNSAYINEYPLIFNKKQQQDSKLSQIQMSCAENTNETFTHRKTHETIKELIENQHEDRQTNAATCESRCLTHRVTFTESDYSLSEKLKELTEILNRLSVTLNVSDINRNTEAMSNDQREATSEEKLQAIIDKMKARLNKDKDLNTNTA